MLKTILTLALLLTASSTELLAQGGGSGTRQERDACTRDVTRHCRKIMGQGDFVVLRCLQDNRSKLSAACRKVLTDHGQ
jgi:hypothetical protein